MSEAVDWCAGMQEGEACPECAEFHGDSVMVATLDDETGRALLACETCDYRCYEGE